MRSTKWLEIPSSDPSSESYANSATAGRAVTGAHHRLLRRGRGLLRRAVQGDAVVRTASGFGTVSFERGTVKSVSGAQLTLTEGTRRASYRSVTVTIPTDARIRDDGTRGDLSSLKAGQRVLVITAPRRTFVIARTPTAG